MISKCKVLLQNSEVIVVDYNNLEIQMPAIVDIANHVYVKYEDEKYTITSKKEYDEYVANFKKNKL